MKTIGIIGAMPSELVDIRKALPDSEIQKKAGFDYYINTVGDTRIVHVCSGIAKVNAAVCTQALIDTFQPDVIWNAGIAGGMNRNIHVCDVVVSSEVLPHDLDLHFLNDYPPYCGIFPADKSLIDLAVRTCDEFGVKSFVGRIVSGEAFVTSNTVKPRFSSGSHPMQWIWKAQLSDSAHIGTKYPLSASAAFLTMPMMKGQCLLIRSVKLAARNPPRQV